MSIQTIPVDAGTRRPRTAAGPQTPRDEGRAGAGVLATPFLILYVLFVIGPTMYGIVMSFFNTSLVSSGLGGFAGAGQLHRGAEELRLLAVDVAHRAVHDP